MIEDSIALAARRVPEVMFDAEHFFDGYAADPDYALACLDAAERGGARWIVLCDTNGGAPAARDRARRRAGHPADPARAARHPHPQRHRDRGREQPGRDPGRLPPGPGHPERPRRALRQRQSDRADPDPDAQARLRDRGRRGGAAPLERAVARRSTSASTAPPTATPPTSAPAPSPTRRACTPRRWSRTRAATSTSRPRWSAIGATSWSPTRPAARA